jgi:lipopolysaccharide transport system permease protein
MIAARLAMPAPRRVVYLRDLLSELVALDVKIRYRGSLLGFLWSLLNPLAYVAVLTLVFRTVLPLDIANYPAFVFSGQIAWAWFTASVMQAARCIVDSGPLIRRPGFPVTMLPAVTVAATLVHFLLALPILLVFELASGGHLTPLALLTPAIVALQFVLILSLAYLVAAAHVVFRDTQHIVGVGILLGYFVTPIFYDIGRVPPDLRGIFGLNPMVHVIGAYRAVLLEGQWPDVESLVVVAVVSCFLLWLGLRLFVSTSHRFAEEL